MAHYDPKKKKKTEKSAGCWNPPRNIIATISTTIVTMSFYGVFYVLGIGVRALYILTPSINTAWLSGGHLNSSLKIGRNWVIEMLNYDRQSGSDTIIFLNKYIQPNIIRSSVQFSSVQLLSHVRLFATPWLVECQASLSITNSRSLLRLMSNESMMPSNHLILCHPLLLLPPIPPSIGVFSNESALHIRWPKYWSFSFSISPSNEHPGLISFRVDW